MFGFSNIKALFIREVLISSGVQSGWICLRRATEPVTCGVAIDVPLQVSYFPSKKVEVISTPGAVISGLNTSSGVGPCEEKSAITGFFLVFFLPKVTFNPLFIKDFKRSPSFCIINTAGTFLSSGICSP